MAGINKSTLYRWLDKGKEDREEIDSLYADFCNAKSVLEQKLRVCLSTQFKPLQSVHNGRLQFGG